RGADPGEVFGRIRHMSDSVFQPPFQAARIDHATLRGLLDYEPETGLLRWKVSRGRGVRAGDIAGCDRRCYIIVHVLSRPYYAHRLACARFHGNWAALDLDHIDGNSSSNRLDNLREATQSQNSANSRRAGRYLKGTYKPKRSGRWAARIKKDGKDYYLGCFS